MQSGAGAWSTEPAAGSSVRARSGDERVAVVDIGSNSIRLVVFEGFKRVPTPVFNEKVICGLGQELDSSGRLGESAMEMALRNLERFARLVRGMGIGEVVLLATAAAREAENGADFIAEVERCTGYPVRLLSGEEEATISGHGVLAGSPEAHGVMGDLGGGSLELVRLGGGEIIDWATLTLGPLRQARRAASAAEAEINRQLDGVPWLAEARGGNFYAVGGAWRAIARILMDQNDYPLHVIQGYKLPRRDVDPMMRLLSGLGRRSLAQIASVSRRRIGSVPYAARLLRTVARRLESKAVIWSSYGLREGFLYDRLGEAERNADPLLATVRELGRKDGRFEAFSEAVARWTTGLFPEESPDQTRLREAASHLADLSWREHPDFRARQALWRVLYFPFAGLDHPGRAFLAYAVYCRYGGGPKEPEAEIALQLLSSKARRRARVLGLAMRLAFALAAGVPELLESTSLAIEDDRLRLKLPSDGSVPPGTAVERRFLALLDAAELEGEIVGG